MPYDLRPLTLGELLDRSFGLYRRRFWLFVGIMAPTSIVTLLFTLGGQLVTGFAALSNGQQPANPDLMIFLGLAIIAGAIVALGIYWITYAVALGATSVAVSELYAGREASIAKAYAATRGRFGRLVWLIFLLFIRVFGLVLVPVMLIAVLGAGVSAISPVLGVLLMLLLFGGWALLMVWVLLRYAVAAPAAVLEDNTAGEAIARSIDLTRGNLLRILVLFVFTVIVNYAAMALLQGPFTVAAVLAGDTTIQGFWLAMAGALTGSIAAALTSPLAVVAMAVLYYDLRIRKEGLDLELLVAALTETPAAAPGASSAVLPG